VSAWKCVEAPVAMIGFDPETGEVVHLEGEPNEPKAMTAALTELADPLRRVMKAGTDS
jgi:hypothetical protein